MTSEGFYCFVELHPEPPEACIDPPEQLVRPRDAFKDGGGDGGGR